MILLAVEAHLMLFPGVFLAKYWVAHYDYYAYGYSTSYSYKATSWTNTSKTAVNIFGITTALGEILAVLTLSLVILAIVVFLLMFLRKENMFTKICSFATIASFVIFVILGIYAWFAISGSKSGSHYNYETNWLFYVIAVLHIGAIVLSMLARFKKYAPAPAAQPAVQQPYAQAPTAPYAPAQAPYPAAPAYPNQPYQPVPQQQQQPVSQQQYTQQPMPQQQPVTQQPAAPQPAVTQQPSAPQPDAVQRSL